MLAHSKTHQLTSSGSARDQYKAEIRERFSGCPHETAALHV